MVAEMKAVILRLNPQAAIGRRHTTRLRPQAVSEGAEAVGRALRVFGPDTVHVAVIDPRRGHGPHRPAADDGRAASSWRRTTACSPTRSGRRRSTRKAIDGADFHQRVAVPVPAGCAAYRLSNDALWRKPVRPHVSRSRRVRAGRGAPVARRTAAGGGRAAVVDDVPRHPAPAPAAATSSRDTWRTRTGSATWSRPFRTEAVAGRDVEVSVAGRRIRGLSRSYEEGGELLAIIGSSGRLEIAAPRRQRGALAGAWGWGRGWWWGGRGGGSPPPYHSCAGRSPGAGRRARGRWWCRSERTRGT